MHFIKHIIEPTKLFLAWQSLDEAHRLRYIIAELNRIEDRIDLTYLINSKDFQDAKKKGFNGYPAFQDTEEIHSNVLDAFMRRLPPRTRGDFPQYLETLRIKDASQLSEFALLGYSGAKLPSDGFSIIHPFNNVEGACEFLLEVAGFRHNPAIKIDDLKIDDTACFSIEEMNIVTQEAAVRISVGNQHIGYVNKGLIPTFLDWINAGRISGAWIERKNGYPGKPTVYLYVKILPKGCI